MSRHPLVAHDGDSLPSRRADSGGPVEPVLRYRIEVIASSVEDLVRSAGGWLFDRRMAGWKVDVRVPGDGDFRPLQVLGFRPVGCDGAAADALPAQAMAVCAHLVEIDTRLRENVARALASGRTEVTMWGGFAPRQLDHTSKSVRYRLSSAALAFKTQAMLAASGRQHTVRATEDLFDYAGWCRPDGSDSRRFGGAMAATEPKRAQAVLNPVAYPQFRSGSMGYGHTQLR